jgi:two-component system, OmpR family, heavy metal sensor histidine kinase CusS
MTLSIRVKLTALYSLVVIVSFVSFFWVSDLSFRHSIETTVNEASRTNLEIVRRLLHNQVGRGGLEMRAKLQELSELWANGAIFEVADATGKWILRSPKFEDANPPLREGQGAEILFFTTNLDSFQYRVALQRVDIGDQAFEVHVAVPTEPFEQALDNFRLLEKEILPLLVCVAALLGYWLSGRSLAPVNRIIETTERIGVDNLSRRLDVPRARDELRRLTEAINAMLERIERSFQRITQFTADASHDLRTPVAVIRTSAELSLRRPRTLTDYRETLHQILKTSIETSELLDNLLTLARADAGVIGMELHPLDLDQHVRKAQEHARVLSSDKHLEIVLRVPGTPVWVRADAVAIDRLLLILVDNAVKYTPAGGRCEIELLRRADHAEVTVRDTGLGIPESDLSSIFERFTRVNRARSRDIPGSGLGLAIARWITDMHGGTIAAESHIGAGSAFHVRLPAIAANASRPSRPISTATMLSERNSGSF